MEIKRVGLLQLDNQVFRIAPPPTVALSGTRTSEDFLPCQAKNQELRPLVLKQLDFLNAWQGKKSYSPLVLNVPDRATVGGSESVLP